MPGGPRICPKLVCLGQIGAAHGVRGEVRLRSFTADPEAIVSYGPLQTEDGRIFKIESLRPAKDHFVATLSGIADRNTAERLANTKLYVARDRLPEPDQPDEYYHADLIGLSVVDRAGSPLGTVVAVHNFGAGDLIEVRRTDGEPTQLLPFDALTVPDVDLTAGRLVVELPAERE
jgi:16S rRNA processing protein RimM